MIRRIDPVGRIAYGALCIAAMAALAFPLLVIIGMVAGAFFAIFFTMWPLAADWVTEWGGYALGFAIAGVGLAVMAVLVFLMPMPLYLAVIVPMAGTVVAGIAVAGRLAGLGAPAAQPRIPAKALRRR